MFMKVRPALIVTHKEKKMIRNFSLLLFLFLAFTGAIFSQESILVEGKITYLTADQIYCDVGTIGGASVGDTLKVLRREQELGLILITNVARKSSVCLSLVPASVFQLGDKVVLDKMTKPLSQPNEIVKDRLKETVEKPQKSKLKQSGNLSFRYTDTQFSNNNSANRGIGSLNYRLRYDGLFKPQLWIYGRSDLADKEFKLYQARLTFGSSTGKLYVQVGRVFSPALSGIGATDGLLASTTIKRGISLGVLGGFSPNPQNLNFDKNISKTGGYIHFKNQSPNFRMIGSIAFAQQKVSGKTDREFIFWTWRGNVGNTFSLAMYQTVDLYPDTEIGVRNKMTPTSSQISVRFRPIKSITIRSRYSARRQVLYFESAQTLPDSLFQDELRSGWYNTIQLSMNNIGSFQLGANLRNQKSADRPAVLAFMSFRSPSGSNGRTYNLKTNYIRNDLITGVRFTVGLDQSLGKKISIYAEADGYSYGYGTNWSDYFQQRINVGMNWRIFSKLQMTLSADYTQEDNYSFQYVYAGLNYRF